MNSGNTTVNIRGVPVTFPFEPYKNQITYMELVIQALQDSQNGLLESPTGTGKTLCLLTATLAWREQRRIQLEQARDAMKLAIETNDPLDDLVANSTLKMKLPTIFYASRTHSQLTQVLKEFNRTVYAAGLKVCVLGSRSQLCIHPTVSQTRGGISAVNRACVAAIQKVNCQFHTNSEIYKFGNAPVTRDMEDLILWGRQNDTCPFYIAKEQQLSADIIFLPYNYLIDPLIRSSLSVDFYGSIVILDEAHNLDQVATEAASFDLTYAEIKTCLSGVNKVMDLLSGSEVLPPVGSNYSLSTSLHSNSPISDLTMATVASSSNPEFDWTHGNADLVSLKSSLQLMLTEFDQIPFPAATDVKVFDGSWLYELMGRCGIYPETAPTYIRTIERIINHINEGGTVHTIQNPKQYGKDASKELLQVSVFAAPALSNLSESLRKMFSPVNPVSELSKHFKTVIQKEMSNSRGYSFEKSNDGMASISIDSESNSSSSTLPSSTIPSSTIPHSNQHSSRFSQMGRHSGKTSTKISFWCFYAGLAMKSLKATGIRSMILTSGTLSPLDSFAYETGLSFPIRLENGHVIDTSQIWVGVLSKGVDDETLNASYNNRTFEYKLSLGRTLTNIARIVPGGLLVFFPSYKLMDDCISVWKSVKESNATIWDEISKHKYPVQEPKESSKIRQAIDEFTFGVDASTTLISGSNTYDSLSTTCKGSVFFAVCRGKVSEGLDFSDQYGRAVVVTGLPFPQSLDEKVKLKREYMNNQYAMRISAKRDGNVDDGDVAPLDGTAWYTQSAWRAVNQAIGRVIRHRRDYGAIIFADARFGSGPNLLSKWLRPNIQYLNDPGPVFQSLRKFFIQNAQKLPLVDPDPQKVAIQTVEPANIAMPISSHISSANASRKSAFEALEIIKKESTNLNRTTPGNTNVPAQAAPSATNPNLSSSERAAQNKSQASKFLDIARRELPPSIHDKFQKLLREYKSKTKYRAELYRLVLKLLENYPSVVSALHDYLPQSKVSSSKSRKSSHTDHQKLPASSGEQSASGSSSIPSLTSTSSANKTVDVPELGPVGKRTKRPFEEVSDPTPPPPALRTRLDAVAVDLDDLDEGSVIIEPSANKASSPPKPLFKMASMIEIKDDSQDQSNFIAPPLPIITSANAINTSSSATALSHGFQPIASLFQKASNINSPQTPPSPMSKVDWTKKLNRTPSATNLTSSDPIIDDDMQTDAMQIQSPFKVPLTSSAKKHTVNLLTGEVLNISSRPQFPKFPMKEKTEPEQFVVIPDADSQSQECPICAKLTSEFRSAPCGHAFCNDCWKTWLSQKLECPYCRKRVREKKLSKASP